MHYFTSITHYFSWLFFVFFINQAIASQPLAPTTKQSQTLQEIIQLLEQEHYHEIKLNNLLSNKLLKRYLDALDPTHSLFYAADIEQFQTYKNSLDDSLKAGNLAPAYSIYNLYLERHKERLNYVLTLLQSSFKFDFERNESLLKDRSKTAWVTDKKAMQELWRKQTKYALLDLKLDDKTLAEAKKTLSKRTKRRLKYLNQNKSEEVFERYINALTAIYDPHTNYFSPRDSEDFKINMSLSLEGIGAMLKQDDDFIKVVRLIPGGPADKAGQLKANDYIVAVGQGEQGEMIDAIGERLKDIIGHIRGSKDSIVRLKVRSSSSTDAPYRTIKIKRNKIKLEEQSAQKKIITLQQGKQQMKVGVISIPAFYIDFEALQKGDKNYKSTRRDVEKLLLELQQEGIQGLVIDLRNNAGGSLSEASELIGLFVERGPTVQVRDQNNKIHILGDSDPKFIYKGAMAVLVNRLSASASEIFAGAMQDYQRAIIVGSQTYGKGTVQQLLPLQQGQLKLTNAKFYRISGDSTQHQGIIPDLTFPQLFDYKKVGESALDNALVWDQVSAQPHGLFINPKKVLTTLEKNHQQRIKNQPDFEYLKAQTLLLKKYAQRTKIQLKESLLTAERKQYKAEQLALENKRRIAKNNPPIKKLSELEDLLEKNPMGQPIQPEEKALLEETGHILLDMRQNLLQQLTTR